MPGRAWGVVVAEAGGGLGIRWGGGEAGDSNEVEYSLTVWSDEALKAQQEKGKKKKEGGGGGGFSGKLGSSLPSFSFPPSRRDHNAVFLAPLRHTLVEQVAFADVCWRMLTYADVC